MPYTIAIVGCRDFEDYERFRAEVTVFIDEVLCRNFCDTLIISGGCRTGADDMAFNLCRKENIPFTEYPADWATHGKAAGPIRNRKMAEACDECIAFWDGVSRGTRNMIEQCAKLGKKVTVIGIGNGNEV